jgi:hypothetical protein
MAAQQITRAGLLELLQSTVDGYTARCAQAGQEPDEMILAAGDFLTRTLQPVAEKLRWERRVVLGGAVAAAAGVGAAVALRCWHRIR